jgi:signal peptidase
MTAAVATLPTSDISAAARGRHRVKGKSVPARIFSALASLLLALGVLSLLFMTVGPRVLHYRTATMLTGSMVPTINPGDVVVDTQEPTRDIAIGQIITYHIPIDDRRIESHRVIWVRHNRDGSVAFRTRGDANTAPDPWTAQANTPKVWRVRAVLPVVGSAIRMLRQPMVHLALAVALPAVLVLMLLVTIWKPSGESAKGAAAKDAAAKDEPASSHPSR